MINSAGEDTIYFCNRESCEFGQNKEVFDYKVGEPCPICKEGIITEDHSIEVGNIFPLGIKKYAEKMGFSFTDKDGSKKPVWFGSYGIGPTRVMGTIVEEYHDEKGIIWPKKPTSAPSVATTGSSTSPKSPIATTERPRTPRAR